VSPRSTWLWLGSAFSSALLLFVAQPMLAKWLLPAFGGTPGTWAACMLFFQLMLLLGYGYAHALSWLGSARAALGLHALLALAAAGSALVSMPLMAADAARWLAPSLRIPWLLFVQVGPAYLLVSSTAPLLSRWAAQLGAALPHRLYAVSNAGSLLGLLGYPWLIEGLLPIAEQYRLWAFGCFGFGLVSAGCALHTLVQLPVQPPQPFAAESPPSRAARLYWAFCAFVPSVFLLAVTNHITIDVAAVPLLWVVPLALYLLSFIAAFAGRVGAWRGWLVPLWIVLSIGLGYNAIAEGSSSLARQLTCSLGALLTAALLCHDALVRARPAASQLTGFYLWIAVGGAAGGVFVTLCAPSIWNDYYELELASALTYVVLLVSLRREPQRRWLWAGVGLYLPLLAAAIGLRAFALGSTGHVLERRRSFLGSLRVTELQVGRILTHGRIRHGMQLSDPRRALWPTMYFGAGTALARVFETHATGRARRIGVVGLGVGTIAAYGRAGDTLRFYELDPNVRDIASHWFSFLRDTPARTEFALGDGRWLLAHEPAQRFDVLVLDAFASDSVPAHLLTREAFEIYQRHLAPDAVLLANVSNRHLAVDRVVRAAAHDRGLACEVVETPADADRFVSKVRWAVMTREPAQLARELGPMQTMQNMQSEVLWTDARASLWSIVR
jgi:hypothetical protein